MEDDNINNLDKIDAELKARAQMISSRPLAELMHQPNRCDLIFEYEDMMVDLTRQPLDADCLTSLLELAKARQLDLRLEEMFSGSHVNLTENRPAIHCALRHPDRQADHDYLRLSAFAEQVRADKKFRHIINLGIGGSDLGPAMVYQGLSAFHDGPEVHYVGNIDPSALHGVLEKCEPAASLFIIASKSFTTAETLTNAELAKGWLTRHGITPETSMVAVTARPEIAGEWGVAKEQIFAFADGVGGRYSLWSAVGLSVMIAIGERAFSQLLAGAHNMDTHFRQASWAQNIPVIMGALRVWHRTYLGRPSYGIMPYAQHLARLPAWVQQLEMESNGKQVDRQGQRLNHPAAPLIWGEPGTNGQHSFFQWLHQGMDIVPIDILVPLRAPVMGGDADWQASHDLLVTNAIAQAEALALGSPNAGELHRNFTGNRPSVLISWEAITPYALGRLLALYEHITVVSGFLWNINSFDQWGVELGKEMATVLQNSENLDRFSPAAQILIARLKNQ